MSSVPYLAFAASDALRDDTELLIGNIQAGVRQSQLDQINLVMSKFIPEMLDRFLLDTCEVVQLSPMNTKIVRGAANTLSKTGNMLVKQLLKKRTNEELMPVIEYLDSVFIRASESSSNVASIACAIDHSLYARMKETINNVREGNPQDYIEELSDLMLRTSDHALVGYAETPINLLQVNFVVRKVTNAGLDTCRSAIKMVINKVFRRLDDEQLIRLVDYFECLLITGPEKAQTFKR